MYYNPKSVCYPKSVLLIMCMCSIPYVICICMYLIPMLLAQLLALDLCLKELAARRRRDQPLIDSRVFGFKV